MFKTTTTIETETRTVRDIGCHTGDLGRKHFRFGVLGV